MSSATTPGIAEVQEAFRDFVTREEFPCLGARATLARNAATVRVFGSLCDSHEVGALAAELESFGSELANEDAAFGSMIAVFPRTPPVSETEFDSVLWRQLGALREMDKSVSPDARRSDNPENPHYAFRFRDVAYFVVGLCPSSSRLARRFAWPALVFNPHSVFDRLRDEGKYDRLKTVIREREIALQGSLNPNLADFGEVSEARQYSGLVHPPEWKCPFHKEA